MIVVTLKLETKVTEVLCFMSDDDDVFVRLELFQRILKGCAWRNFQPCDILTGF